MDWIEALIIGQVLWLGLITFQVVLLAESKYMRVFSLKFEKTPHPEEIARAHLWRAMKFIAFYGTPLLPVIVLFYDWWQDKKAEYEADRYGSQTVVKYDTEDQFGDSFAGTTEK